MMSTLSTENRRAQAGFTLVELAIVLVIVGLLIGGILKGQELIAATRVNSTVSQIKAIDASTYTFQDTYGALPGDLPSPATRLPSCLTTNGCVPSTTTNLGNGHLDGTVDGAIQLSASSAGESAAFFIQMGLAELIGGINNPSGSTATIGVNVLGSPLGTTSHYRAGYHTADITAPTVAGTTPNNAHFLLLGGQALAQAYVGGTGTGTLDGFGIPSKAASSIDTKMDDGKAAQGSVRGAGSTAYTTTSCISETTDTGEYKGLTTNSCGILVRFNQ